MSLSVSSEERMRSEEPRGRWPAATSHIALLVPVLMAAGFV